MNNTPVCTTPPLVLPRSLQLLSGVNDVEIGVMSWRVMRSLAWENSLPPPVGRVSASSPTACLWRITLAWLASRCSGWRLNGFHPAVSYHNCLPFCQSRPQMQFPNLGVDRPRHLLHLIKCWPKFNSTLCYLCGPGRPRKQGRGAFFCLWVLFHVLVNVSKRT